MQDTAQEKWFLWRDEARPAALNMAIDEVLLAEISSINTPILRLYSWDTPSVSIGYVQDFAAAPQEGYKIVRRPTGGGVVFHVADLTYTVVLPPRHRICSFERVESYRVFHRIVLKALEAFGVQGSLAPDGLPGADRATMRCFNTPTRYDVLDGSRKLAGAAQRRTRNGLLHQGSIMLDAAAGDGNMLSSQLLYAWKEILGAEFSDFTPNEEFFSRAKELAGEKYANDAWNKDRIWDERRH
ncbi:MAG: hypothetical protein A2X49_16910 [Lentisphaerae bacterium GWF2_52_8]|nr:MAG: hypothetical protein A2X49_16910 [Lentisphaerae bacterium GWF2_52_8]